MKTDKYFLQFLQRAHANLEIEILEKFRADINNLLSKNRNKEVERELKNFQQEIEYMMLEHIQGYLELMHYTVASFDDFKKSLEIQYENALSKFKEIYTNNSLINKLNLQNALVKQDQLLANKWMFFLQNLTDKYLELSRTNNNNSWSWNDEERLSALKSHLIKRQQYDTVERLKIFAERLKIFLLAENVNSTNVYENLNKLKRLFESFQGSLKNAYFTIYETEISSDFSIILKKMVEEWSCQPIFSEELAVLRELLQKNMGSFKVEITRTGEIKYFKEFFYHLAIIAFDEDNEDIIEFNPEKNVVNIVNNNQIENKRPIYLDDSIESNLITQAEQKEDAYLIVESKQGKCLVIKSIIGFANLSKNNIEELAKLNIICISFSVIDLNKNINLEQCSKYESNFKLLCEKLGDKFEIDFLFGLYLSGIPEDIVRKTGYIYNAFSSGGKRSHFFSFLYSFDVANYFFQTYDKNYEINEKNRDLMVALECGLRACKALDKKSFSNNNKEYQNLLGLLTKILDKIKEGNVNTDKFNEYLDILNELNAEQITAEIEKYFVIIWSMKKNIDLNKDIFLDDLNQDQLESIVKEYPDIIKSKLLRVCNSYYNGDNDAIKLMAKYGALLYYKDKEIKVDICKINFNDIKDYWCSQDYPRPWLHYLITVKLPPFKGKPILNQRDIWNSIIYYAAKCATYAGANDKSVNSANQFLHKYYPDILSNWINVLIEFFSIQTDIDNFNSIKYAYLECHHFEFPSLLPKVDLIVEISHYLSYTCGREFLKEYPQFLDKLSTVRLSALMKNNLSFTSTNKKNCLSAVFNLLKEKYENSVLATDIKAVLKLDMKNNQAPLDAGDSKKPAEEERQTTSPKP